MAIKAAMWVHGTAVEAENPVHSIARKGWGTHFILPYRFNTPQLAAE